MTTILLQLNPAAAKFFQYHHDDDPTRPSPLRDQFKNLIMLLAEPHPNGLVKGNDTKVQIRTEFSTEYPAKGIDARYVSYYIPDHKMKTLNDLMIQLIDQEVNKTVELYLNVNATMKDVFQTVKFKTGIDKKLKINDAIKSVLEKYDLDENDGYDFDRAKKMNQRYRKRLNL